MKLAHESLEQLSKQLLEIIEKEVGSSKINVFFFGSRVTEKGSERSDIDLGIEADSPLPHSTLANIQDAIDDLPILYSIEVVDFKRVSSDFYAVAKENIYPLKND